MTKKTTLRRKRRHVIRLGEIAYQELSLNYSSWTQADVTRVERMMRAMRELDDKHARAMSLIEKTLKKLDKAGLAGVGRLADGFKTLRRLVEQNKAEVKAAKGEG